MDGKASNDETGSDMTLNFVNAPPSVSGKDSLNYIFESRSELVSSPDIHKSGEDMGQYDLRCNSLLLPHLPPPRSLLFF